MTRSEGPGSITPTEFFARQVRRYRLAREWSQPQLADRCKAAGLDWNRSIVANLEAGRRGQITVQELLVLASVLSVPPVLLLSPVGTDELVEVIPEVYVDPWSAARWIRGDAPSPATTDADSIREWRRSANVLGRLREHDQAVAGYRQAQEDLAASRRRSEAMEEAGRSNEVGDTELLMEQTVKMELGRYGRMIIDLERAMVAAGLVPPKLPPDLHTLALGDARAKLLSEHAGFLNLWSAARADARKISDAALGKVREGESDQEPSAGDYERVGRELRRYEAQLRDIRREIQLLGFAPPDLPAELDGLDRTPDDASRGRSRAEDPDDARR